jgi:hypothetical protein
MTFKRRPDSITDALLALIAERPGLTIRDYAPELGATTRRLDSALWNLQRKGIVQEGRKVPGWRTGPMRTWYLAGKVPEQSSTLIDQHPLSMAWATKPNVNEQEAV